MDDFWVSTTANILGGVISSLVVTLIVWATGRRHGQAGGSARTPGGASPSGLPSSGGTATAADGAIAVGKVGRKAKVDAKVKNVTNNKKITVNNGPSGSGGRISGSAAKSNGNNEEWWPLGLTFVISLVGIAVLALWIEHIFLWSSILAGASLGSYIGTTLTPAARRDWKRGSTLISLQAGMFVVAFIAIWTGILNTDKMGWNLDALRTLAARELQGDLSNAGRFLSELLGSGGFLYSLWLVLAVLSGLVLSILQFLTVVVWWRYLAVASSESKKVKSAKRRRKEFGKASGRLVFLTLGAPFLFAVIGVVSAFALFLPA